MKTIIKNSLSAIKNTPLKIRKAITFTVFFAMVIYGYAVYFADKAV
jgi:hypothetical protein